MLLDPAPRSRTTAARSTGAGVGCVVGIWFLADALKYPLHIDRYVFSTYLETPWRVFVGRCNALNPAWFPDAKYCIIASLAYLLVFIAVAMFTLSRRDIRA